MRKASAILKMTEINPVVRRDLTCLSSVRCGSGATCVHRCLLPERCCTPKPSYPHPIPSTCFSSEKSHPQHMNQALCWRSVGVRSHAGWQVSLFRRSLSSSVAEAQVWRDGRYFRWWRDKSDHFWSEEESTEGAFLLILLWDVNGSVALKEEQVSDAKRVSVRVHEFQPLTVGAPHMGKHQCIP